MSFKIAKSTGKHEAFNVAKIEKSLKKAGASDQLAQEIAAKAKKDPKIKSTKDLHRFTLGYLAKRDPVVAARYNLKYALLELGPAGYPFERFIAELFAYQGYKVGVNENIKGFCVEHEVDVLAKKDTEKLIIECKFHNRRGLKSDVKVVLYAKERFDDIKKECERAHDKLIPKPLIITNTNFTTEALKYGKCVGIDLIDWNNPPGKSLPDIINNLGLHPITTLTSLNNRQKKAFIENGFMLCRQAPEHIPFLKTFGLTDHQIKKIVDESVAVCEFDK